MSGLREQLAQLEAEQKRHREQGWLMQTEINRVERAIEQEETGSKHELRKGSERRPGEDDCSIWVRANLVAQTVTVGIVLEYFNEKQIDLTIPEVIQVKNMLAQAIYELDSAALAQDGIVAIDRQVGNDPCPVCGEPRVNGIQVRVCCSGEEERT